MSTAVYWKTLRESAEYRAINGDNPIITGWPTSSKDPASFGSESSRPTGELLVDTTQMAPYIQITWESRLKTLTASETHPRKEVLVGHTNMPTSGELSVWIVQHLYGVYLHGVYSTYMVWKRRTPFAYRLFSPWSPRCTSLRFQLKQNGSGWRKQLWILLHYKSQIPLYLKAGEYNPILDRRQIVVRPNKLVL